MGEENELNFEKNKDETGDFSINFCNHFSLKL